VKERSCLHSTHVDVISKDCREFIEAFCEATVLVDAESGRIAALNASAADLFGMREEEIVGHECHRFICPSEKGKCPIHDLGMVIDRSRRDIMVKGKGTTTVVKTVRPLKLGGREFLLETIEPLSKDAESQLARVQQAELFRNLFYENNAVMFIIDPDSGDILEANNAAVSFYGYKIQELRQMNITDINLMPRELALEELGRTRERKETRYTFSHRLASGEMRQVDILRGPIQWEEKKAIYSIIQDVTDKVNSEKALGKKVAELDQLFANAPFSVFLSGGDRRIVRANGKSSEMFGYSQEEMIGKTINELLVPEADRAQARRYGDLIYVENIAQAFEADRRKKDGTLLPVSCMGFPVELAGDTIGGYVIYQDMTEIRKSQRRLEESERKFRSIFNESSAVLLLISAEDGKILEANPAAAKYYGYPLDRLLSMNHSDLSVLEPDRLLAVRKNATVGTKHLIQSKHRLSNGKIRDVEIYWGPIEIAGTVVLFMIVHDITARKRAEDLLKREGAFLDALFDVSPEAVAVTNEKHAINRVNDGFCKLFKCDRKDCIGVDLDTFVTGQKPELLKAASRITEVVSEGKTIKMETVRVTRSGEVFPCSLISIPVRYGNQERGAYSLYRDLREEKKRENELRIAGEIVKKSPAILFRWSDEKEGSVIYVSENIRQLGYKAEELLSGQIHYYRDLVHPDDQERVYGKTRNCADTHLDLIEQEYRLIKADGEKVWVSDRTRIIREESGKILYHEGIVIDITERKKVEELTREANENLRKHIFEMNKAFEQTIRVLASTAEAKDPYTAGHQRRVAELAKAIAGEMGMGADGERRVELAAMVHDIGKVEVPTEILSKPGKLNPVELELVKSHAEASYRILKEIKISWPLAEIVHQHHESLDGTGYPQGLAGEQILLEARIIRVADTIEAISSHRPYRPGLGLDVAFKDLEDNRGSKYDPAVTDACLSVFRKGFKWGGETE